MAELDNRDFHLDPWRVRLLVGAADDEDWRACSLLLVRDPDRSEPLVSLELNLYADELARLVAGLRALASGESEVFDFEPIEPSFLLRGRRWRGDDVELAWFADQGELSASVSTDSGVGVMIRTEPDALTGFADALEAEGGTGR